MSKLSTAGLMTLAAALGFLAAYVATSKAQPPGLELIAPAPKKAAGPLAIPPLSPKTGEFPILILDVIDGDTVRVAFLFSEIVRLHGVNAPELHGETAAAGKASRDWLAGKIPKAPTKMRILGREKYGRILAVLENEDGESLNQALIDAGHAKSWDGKGERP